VARAVLIAVLILSLVGCTTTRVSAPVSEIGGAWHRVARRNVPRSDVYVVRPGDTLFSIAFDRGLDYHDLARWNGLEDPGYIVAGSTLRLSPPPKPAVPRARRMPSPAADHAGSYTFADDQDDTGPITWTWPARGTVVKGFDEARNSKGIDIAAPEGAPVHAAAAGRVMYAGNGLRGYGKLIIIKHNSLLLSAYAHQAKLLVREGDRVVKGQEIGEVGDTDAPRPELHFEIREHGRPVNPMKYLPI
jgi:lipoprotein NlpD